MSSVYGTDTSLLDTPRAVSQVSAEQLARDGLRTADDLVKYAPGVTRNGGQNVSVAPMIRRTDRLTRGAGLPAAAAIARTW